MDLSFRSPVTPAFVAPDEQTWTVAGTDPASLGLTPAFAPGRARRALVADRVPEALIAGTADWITRLPAGIPIEERSLRDLPGEPVTAVVEPGPAGADEDEHRRHGHEHDDHHQDHHDDHGHGHGGGHHDMMAIVGEPSADGLVMESIDIRFGPVATPLPAGLVIDVTLDGDVVADAKVEATLTQTGPSRAVPGTPDLLAPLAWRAALEAASGDLPAGDRWIAAIEVERAVSHLAWLRSLGRLLGWAPLVDRCTRALSSIAEPHLALSAPSGSPRTTAAERLGAATDAVQRVAALVDGSRWLRRRTAGRAALSAEQVHDHGLRGPVARASGVDDDARSGDPRYRRLGFTPAVRHEGDALARTRLRAHEAAMALELAVGALRAAGERAGTVAADVGTLVIEGPRGPLRATHSRAGWTLTAPGAAAARAAAARSMTGLEWSTALVAVASFDLSPWTVPE